MITNIDIGNNLNVSGDLNVNGTTNFVGSISLNEIQLNVTGANPQGLTINGTSSSSNGTQIFFNESDSNYWQLGCNFSDSFDFYLYSAGTETNIIVIDSSSNTINFNGNPTYSFTLNCNGDLNITGVLSGTSATFTGNITVNGITPQLQSYNFTYGGDAAGFGTSTTYYIAFGNIVMLYVPLIQWTTGSNNYMSITLPVTTVNSIQDAVMATTLQNINSDFVAFTYMKISYGTSELKVYTNVPGISTNTVVQVSPGIVSYIVEL